VSDPIAPLDVLATNAHFSDPAIDHATADDGPTGEERLEAYRRSRDPKELSFLPGLEPHRFRAKPLPAVFAASVLEGMVPSARNALAFATACHEVVLPDGATLRPRSVKASSHGTRCSDDEWVNTIAERFGLETVYEVGRVAYERARLPRGARGPFSWWGA
jgi:hypothetical protein